MKEWSAAGYSLARGSHFVKTGDCLVEGQSFLLVLNDSDALPELHFVYGPVCYRNQCPRTRTIGQPGLHYSLLDARI